MKKCLLVLMVMLFFNITLIQSSCFCQSQILNKDSILNEFTVMKEKTGVKALLGGVWKGEEEIISAALGESMTSVPANIDMHIRIGGVSETFLGTLVMMLAGQGKISLDDKISKWLPDFLAADKVTIAMLIKNTAGYKDYVLNTDFVKLVTKEPFRNFSREDILSYATGDGQLNFSPGTNQHYSHTEFTILGEVIERATGKKMHELYKENIFQPLGLNHTGYSVNSDLPVPVLHAFSSDRGIYEEATFWNPSWTGDSGPLYSTIHDLSRWALAFGKGKLLKPEFFDSLVSRPAGAVNPDLYFASGFAVGNGWYFQNPSFNGYSGAFGYLPSQDLIIIIFTTESQDPKSGAQAFNIFKELVKQITPESEINF